MDTQPIDRGPTLITMESQLGQDLRDVVVELVRTDASKLEQIAEGLDVPVESVSKLLTQSRWDLGLTMKILDRLQVRVRVVAA